MIIIKISPNYNLHTRHAQLPPGNGTFFKFSYDVSTFLRLYGSPEDKKNNYCLRKAFFIKTVV